MKNNKLTIILILIIILLLSYIVYDKFFNQSKVNAEANVDNEITLVQNLNLEYLSFYLTSDGYVYLKPINEEEIKNISGGKNLKERLSTLYKRSFYYDLFIDNNRLKGYRIKLDSKIKKLVKMEKYDNIYIIFIKENNTIALFNYDEYYNLLYTNVEDNYHNYQNVQDIKDNKIIYLDGHMEDIMIEE